MTEKLLVILEPDNYPEAVLDRAAWLAGARGKGLTLLWADQDVSPLGIPFFVSADAQAIASQILEAQQVIVEELAQPLRESGLEVDTRVLEERPVADGVLAIVEEISPEMIIKGTHHHPTAERSIFVDADWQLMREAPCPLWLVKPGKPKENPLVLAAVDPFHAHDKPASLDRRIVAASSDIASAAGGEVHLLHTYDLMMGLGRAANRTFKPIRLKVDEIESDMRREHREMLATLARQCGVDSEKTHILSGSAREMIPAFARELGADLVVMGALARWGIKRAVIGSTAERVLDALHCDVLVVRDAPRA